MKKPIATLLLVLLTLSACSNTTVPGSNTSGNAPQSGGNQPSAKALSFDADFTWTKDFAGQYVTQENMAQISYSGPFYFGSFPGTDSYTKAYTEARNKHVDDILKVVDESVGYIHELNEITRNYRNVLDWYVLNSANYMPEVKEDLYGLLDSSNHNAVLNTAKMLYLDALTQKLASMQRDSEWGFMTYTRYFLTFDITDNLGNELADLNRKLVVIYTLNKAKAFPELIALNAQLDNILQPVSAKADELYNKLSYNGALLAHEEKVLTTADRYFAKDVLDNFNTQIPKLKDAVKNYQFTKPAVDKTAVQVMNDQLAMYQDFANNLKTYIDTIPAGQFTDKPEFTLPGQAKITGFIPSIARAHAGFYDAMSWVGGKIVGAAEAGASVAATGAGLAWDGTKYVAGKTLDAGVAISDATGVTPYIVKAKDATITTVKFGGKVIGAGLDTASAIVKTPVDVASAVYYGESYKDAKATIKENFTNIADNIHNGTEGHQVYEDTKTILDKVDSNFADAVSGLTEYTIGKGITSNTLGFAAKTVSGFFTGFGKDLVTALNPNTSEKDTLISLFGLALSTIGGTGSGVKGSQALTGAGNKIYEGLGSLKTFLTNVDKDAVKAGLTDLFDGGLKGAINKIISEEGASMAFSGLSDLTSIFKTNLGTALEDGYTMLKGNLMSNVPKAFEGLFESKALSEVFKDVLGVAGKDNWRQGTIGLLDNIVGSMADDQVKAWLDSGLQQIGISEKTITGLIADRKAAIEAIKAEIIKQLPELTYLFSVVTPGTYSSTLSYSNSQSGISQSGSGPISVTVANDMSATCAGSMDFTVSGNYNGMHIGGSGKATVADCSGSINPDNGDLKLQGSLSGMGNVTVSGYGASQTQSANGKSIAFTGHGQIEDGVVTGTLQARGFSMEITGK